MRQNTKGETSHHHPKAAWQTYLKLAVDAILLFAVGYVLTCFRLSFDNKLWQLGISVIYYYGFISFYLRAKKTLGTMGGLLAMVTIMGLITLVVDHWGYFPVLQETVKP